MIYLRVIVLDLMAVMVVKITEKSIETIIFFFFTVAPFHPLILDTSYSTVMACLFVS